DYGIALTKLSTSAITSDRSFDISLNAKIQDNIENVQALIKSTGQLQYSSSNDQLGFDELVTTISLQLDNTLYPEINLTSKGQWRPSQQAVVLTRNDIRVSSANIASSGVINLAGETPVYDGVVNLQTADPAQLSRDFDVALPVKFLQFTADVAVDQTLIHMRTLEGEFDESKFKGAATLEMSPTAAITADIRIDKLDVTAYLSGSPAKDTAGMTKPNTKPIAPTDSEL
ncbi:MAG: hypothetical protein ACNYPE_04370, partial [Candidatus Azotimanducaceae bacterium WSBS_2022_MAG_OTU7]